MLKLFYKTLLVSFISGSLLLMDFSYKGSVIQINSVSAETLKLDPAKDGDLMGTLAMTGISLVAGRLYTCKMTTDMMLAAAGGAAYIAGEILAFFKLKEVIKGLQTEILRTDKGELDQKQIESLEKLKKSYQAALETAGTKKNLQMVAAAAFAAAGVMAYMQYNAEQAALTACSGALSAAGGACAAAFAATCSGGGTCMYPLKSGGMQATSTIAPITNQAIMSLTPAMSAAKQAADKALEQGNRASYTAACSQCSGACGAASACEPMFALNFSTKGYCPAPLSLTDNSAIGNILYAHNFTPINSQVGQEKGMANFLQSLLLNDANADLFTPMGIASSAAISYILATSKTIGMQIDMFLFSPFNRVITWAGIGLTIALATKATDNQIAIIKNNISKIDQILNAMYAYKNGTPASNAATVTPSVTNPTTGQTTVQNNSLNLNNAAVSDIDLKAKGATALPCITGNDPKKCASFSGQLNAQNDIKLMPPFVQQQISMIGKVTDGINGTSKITASTLSDAKTLANANNALRTELAKQQKSLQDKLKASGNKTDIAASSAKFSDDLRAIMQKELDKNKSTAGAILASFGGGTAGNIGNNGATNSNTTASDTSKTPESNSLKNAINANADLGLDNGVLGAASNASGSKLKDEESEDAAALKANGLNSKAAGLKNSLDDFDLKNDISKDKDTSLFQLISNRYQKSGYDRLFKRVK